VPVLESALAAAVWSRMSRGVGSCKVHAELVGGDGVGGVACAGRRAGCRGHKLRGILWGGGGGRGLSAPELTRHEALQGRRRRLTPWSSAGASLE
jgi:hypothetical protein